MTGPVDGISGSRRDPESEVLFEVDRGKLG